MIPVRCAALLVALTPLPALAVPADPPPAAPATAVDAGRLAAATRVMARVLPPAERERMISQMLEPVFENIRSAMTDAPGAAELFAANPKAARRVEEFMADQRDRTMAQMRDLLPGLVDAMTRAYGRRFTVAQLDEIERFYATPTGQELVGFSTEVMADPDVAAWMQRSMEQTLADLPQRLQTLSNEIMTLEPEPETSKGTQ